MGDESADGLNNSRDRRLEVAGPPTEQQELESDVPLPAAPEHDLDYHQEPNETTEEWKERKTRRSKWAHHIGTIVGFVFIVVGLALNYAANIDTNIDSTWQGYGVALFVTGLVFLIISFVTRPIGEAPSEFVASGQFNKQGKISPSQDENPPPPGEL